MGLAHEGDLASEEVLEVDELGVVEDELVGLGLEGELDVDAEGAVAARSLEAGRHDPWSGPGHDHPVVCSHGGPEVACGRIGGVALGDSGGTEHGGLADGPVRLED